VVGLKALAGFLPVFYTLSWTWYLVRLVRPKEDVPALNPLPLLLFVHLAFLLGRGFYLGRCPLSEFWELVSFLALALVGVQLFTERREGFAPAGVPVLGLALVLQTLASSFFSYDPYLPGTIRNWLVRLHVALAICGHAGFFTGGCYAFLYLVLYRQLKAHRLDTVWSQLPPLETTYKLNVRAVGLGLVLFALAIIAGSVRASMLGSPVWPLISSLAVWGIFGGLLLLRHLLRLSGLRFAVGSLFAVTLDGVALGFSLFLHQAVWQGL